MTSVRSFLSRDFSACMDLLLDTFSKDFSHVMSRIILD